MTEPSSPDASPERYDPTAHDYDAVLVVSFGGPEGPDDVMPFLENVLEGLKLPPQAVKGIARRYQRFGGVSPINAHTRDLIAALEAELAAHSINLPVYWGNRNWHPFLNDTLAQMHADGIERAIAYITSTFGSYSGCRRYREDLYTATVNIERPPIIDKLRLGYNHPGFVQAMAERVRDALATVPAERRELAPLVFTAHSLPVSMAQHAPYEAQLTESAQLVTAALGRTHWELAYQSNNASYGEPWLEPRIEDVLVEKGKQGTTDVVVAPIGFVCDHMEVVLDLDVEAKQAAADAGVNLVRAGTVGSHPSYVAMIRELIEERMDASAERRALGRFGPSHDFCAVNCCLSGRPGEPKPSLCGVAAG
ncbi:MAG: ferrochelatase [Gammaproteobacteria bacterium]|nr:ferrochelatase [Gammaproteobacteria bacterium]